MTRVLFVSEAKGGGSIRSQQELARQLLARGHDPSFLVTRAPTTSLTRWFYDRLSDASVHLAPSPLGPAVSVVRDRIGGRAEAHFRDALQHYEATIVANAVPEILRRVRPDVVVVSSVERWAWQQIHRICARDDTPVVLYVREDDSLRHLEKGHVPDVLLANADSLAERLRGLGHVCTFIPSLIDVSVTRTESSRRAVLAINPVESRGGTIFWAVAERLQHIPFVMQESWPLPRHELQRVEAAAQRLPNVEFRRQIPPGPDLYGDARLLMVPYRVDNRPRVILEAQSNGIPVVVGNVAALVEAAGAGGASVPLDDIDAWVRTVDDIWHDQERYASLASAAIAHASRPEVDPGHLTDQFLSMIEQAIALRTPGRRRSTLTNGDSSDSGGHAHHD